MKKEFTNQDVVYMCETILGYLDSGRIDEAKQHLENLQHWFIELPVNGGLSKPKKYAEEFENQLGNPIEQLDKLIDQAKLITEKAKPEKECQCEVCCQLFNSYKASDGSYQEDVCPKCYEFPNPSPLEIEEIEEIEGEHIGRGYLVTEEQEVINQLIRNQKKIISYLKKR